jgi:hypothetical protein
MTACRINVTLDDIEQGTPTDPIGTGLRLGGAMITIPCPDDGTVLALADCRRLNNSEQRVLIAVAMLSAAGQTVTMRKLADMMGWSGMSHARATIMALSQKGHLNWTPNRSGIALAKPLEWVIVNGRPH